MDNHYRNVDEGRLCRCDYQDKRITDTFDDPEDSVTYRNGRRSGFQRCFQDPQMREI